MAKHRRIDSVDGATGAVSGNSEKTRGHDSFTLWVKASGIDPSTDTLEVRVEGSAEGEYFAPINYGAPAVDDVLSLTQDELVEVDASNNVYTGMISSNNHPIEHARVNVVNHSGGFEVTSYIFIGGWSGRGKSFNEREDTPVGELGRY